MSRSYKKAIYKDKSLKSIYWKIVRSRINQEVRQLKYDLERELPNPKEIINDYDYSDYKIDYEYPRNYNYFWYNGNHDEMWTRKLRRK